MAKIDKVQAQAIKRLMQDDAWTVVEIALENRLRRLRDQEVTGNNEFETLRALHKQQGKVEGLAEFFEDLEKQVFDE